MVNKVFLTRIGNIHFITNVLEGLFGEYHSSSVALGNVLSSQSQLSRVLVGLFLAYQVVVCRAQCSTSSGLLPTDFNSLRKSRRLSVKPSILPKQGKAYLPCFRGYLPGIKNSPG